MTLSRCRQQMMRVLKEANRVDAARPMLEAVEAANVTAHKTLIASMPQRMLQLPLTDI